MFGHTRRYKPGTYTSLDKLMNPIWSRIAEASRVSSTSGLHSVLDPGTIDSGSAHVVGAESGTALSGRMLASMLQ